MYDKFSTVELFPFQLLLCAEDVILMEEGDDITLVPLDQTPT